jgi:hypothetical protein
MSETTAPETKQPAPQSPFELGEKIVKAAALLLAIAYGIGMLVSNQYLTGIGASDFASVRPKYVFTGLWTILLIVIAALPIVLMLIDPDKRTFRIFKNFIWTVLFITTADSIVFVLLGANIGLYRALKNPEIFPVSTVNRFLAKCALFDIFIWGVVFGSSFILRKYAIQESHRTKAVARYGLIAMLPVFGLVYATHLVADDFYVRIPEAFGGGEPTAGVIILNDKGESFWDAAGISSGNTIFDGITKGRTVSILTQDEKVVIVDVYGLLPEHSGMLSRRMTLRRDLIDAIVTHESKTFTPPIPVPSALPSATPK